MNDFIDGIEQSLRHDEPDDLTQAKHDELAALQEHLGASLVNLLQRCEAQKATIDNTLDPIYECLSNGESDLNEYPKLAEIITKETAYIYDNAKHVTQLMAKARELQNELGLIIVDPQARDLIEAIRHPGTTDHD